MITVTSMTAETITALSQLGGTIVTVIIFIWYMKDKNGKTEQVLKDIHKAQEKHSKILMHVAKNHGLDSDVDELIG